MAGPTPVYDQQDLMLIPLLDLVAEPLVSDPSTPTASNMVGRIYRNTTTGRLRYVQSSTVIRNLDMGPIVNGDIDAAAGIVLSKLAQNPLDRSLHTGTQSASSIVDFQTVVRTNKVHDLALATAALNMNGQKVSGAADGTAATDLAAWGQVQNLVTATVNGQTWKTAARVAVATNVSLTAPGATLDGIAMATNDRVLLTAQTTASQNGLYRWNGAAVAMTRTDDANTSAEVTSGMTVPITEGSQDNKVAILTTNGAITLDTTALAFTYLGASGGTYTSGAGILISGSVISISNVPVANGGTGATDAAGARTNLGASKVGNVFAIPALTAGVEATVTHNFGTLNVTLEPRLVSDKMGVSINTRPSGTNTIAVKADIDVAASTLEIVVNPVVS